MSNRVPELEKLLNGALFGKSWQRAKPSRIARRPRDTQKRKLYRAEREAFATLPEHPREAYGSEIEDFLHAIRPESDPHVVLKRRGRTSTAHYARARIEIAPVHLRLRWVWVHEFAHLENRATSAASHGREFAAVYLDLVGRAFGATWRDRLRDCFDQAGVKWRAPKEISPERRVALVAQGKRLAAGRAAARAGEVTS